MATTIAILDGDLTVILSVEMLHPIAVMFRPSVELLVYIPYNGLVEIKVVIK